MNTADSTKGIIGHCFNFKKITLNNKGISDFTRNLADKIYSFE